MIEFNIKPMKKKIFAIVICMAIAFGGMAQVWEWSTSVGSTEVLGQDYMLDVVADGVGNTFAVGTFNTIIPYIQNGFPPTHQTLLPLTTEGLIVKYLPNGAIQWVQQTGGPGAERMTHVGIDKQGLVHAAVWYGGRAEVWKYDGIGTHLGTTLVSYDAEVGAMEVRGNTIYLGLAFRGTTTLAGQTFTSRGSWDVAWLAMDAQTGAHLWAQHLGGTGADKPTGIAVQSNGAVFGTGTFEGVMQYPGTAPNVVVSVGGRDGFLVNMNKAGTGLHWISTLGGKANEGGTQVVANDTEGGCMVGIEYDSNVLHAGRLVLQSAWGNDVGLVRYNKDGTEILAGSIGGQGAVSLGLNGIQANGTGEILMCGGMWGKVDFNPYTGVLAGVSNGGEDGWMARYTFKVKPVWAHVVGSRSSDRLEGIGPGLLGSHVVTGWHGGHIDMRLGGNAQGGVHPGGVGPFLLTAEYMADARMRNLTHPQCLPRVAGVAVWPNPSQGMVWLPGVITGTQVQITGIGGTFKQKAQQGYVVISNKVPRGAYVVRWEADGVVHTSKVILSK